MALRLRAVLVKQLPETLDAKQWRAFLREFESSIDVDRPCVVLDCSRVRQTEDAAIRLLICCLEGAMKRNGDVRLAAVPPDVLAILEFTGVDRLFQVFETTQDAIDSFHRRTLHVCPHPITPASSFPASENAA